MKTIVFLLLLLISGLTGKAQEQLYCNDTPLTIAIDAKGAEDGNYYLLSTSATDSFYLIKYTSDHSVLWFHVFGGFQTVKLEMDDNKSHILLTHFDSSALFIFNSNGDIFSEQHYTIPYKSMHIQNDRIILNTEGGTPYAADPKAAVLILNKNAEVQGNYEDPEINIEYSLIYVDRLQNIYIGRNVYAWEDDGIGHTLYNYKYTGLIKLSPDGNKLWLYEDLAITVSNENSAIDFIHVDAQNDIYLYLQNYKLQLNELGALERQSELLTGHFLAQPDYQYVPCKGVQLAFFDLVEDAFFTCRFNDDDPFELDFVNTYSLGTTTTSCTLPEHYLDPNGYITFSLRIFSPDQCSLQCFDIDGNKTFFDIDPTWGPHPYSQSENMVPQPDGNILYFYNTYEEIDNEPLYMLFRAERYVPYPIADLSPECPIIESCEGITLQYDQIGKDLSIQIAPDGIIYNEIEYTIYNMLGQSVYRGYGNEQTVIDCHTFAKGTYIVKASLSGSNYCNQKFVVY